MKKALEFLAGMISNMREVVKEMETNEEFKESMAWIHGYAIALLKVYEEREE